MGPGKYTVTASSANKFGTLRCPPVKVEVETPLGRGPGTTVRIVLQLLQDAGKFRAGLQGGARAGWRL